MTVPKYLHDVIIDGAKSAEWDVAVLGRSPEREDVLDFTPPFLVIENGYLVSSGSPISTIDAVDRPRMRIGATQNESVYAILLRTMKNATVIGSSSLAAGAEMLKSGQVDAFAANEANLFELSDTLPGARVLDGRIGVATAPFFYVVSFLTAVAGPVSRTFVQSLSGHPASNFCRFVMV